MDFDAQKKKRAEALDDKRKRIEEMRKLRESRNNDSSSSSSSSGGGIDTRADIDNLVNSLLITKNDDKNNDISSSSSLPPPPSSSSSSSSSSLIDRPKKVLSIVKSLTSITILPKPPILYDKDCQTDDVILSSLSLNDNNDNGNNDNDDRHSPQKLAHRRVIRNNTSPNDTNDITTITNNNDIEKSLDVINKKILTNDEHQLILSSSSFTTFLNQSSKIIERFINNNNNNIIRDYSSLSSSSLRINNNTILSLSFKLNDDNVSNRPIMDIDNSPHYHELFLSSYGSKTNTNTNTNTKKNNNNKTDSNNSSSSIDNDSPGLVYVWSTALKGRPEFKFTSSSPVLVARFDNQDPHLVLGGCYNGQILLWDMRAKSLPVQRSNMSGKGHKHPVYAMCIISSGTSNELVSVSTDGTICHWDISRLSDPTSVLLLQPMEQSTTAGIDTNSAIITAISTSISCMTYTSSDTLKEMIFGCGNGSILYTSLPFRSHDKVNHVNAHSGLITALQMHPSKGKYYKNLLLSASLDWTVKLWNLSHTTIPLMQFYTQSYDYVCDVQWSPLNPTVFCTILSGGDLTLWDLCKSTSEPLEVMKISSNDSSKGALNKCIWSNDGNNVIVGDSKGNLMFLEAQESLIKSNSNDLQRFEINILNSQSKKNTKTDIKDNDNDVVEDDDI